MNPTRVCGNPACSQANPLPETDKYFYYNTVKQRYDTLCKKCRNKQKQLQRGRRRKPYTWSKAFLRGLKSDNYDPRMTADVLIVIMALQNFKCALTATPFLLPTDNDLLVNKRYKGWLNSLPVPARLRTPRLISNIYGEVPIPGNCIFVCNYVYDLYRYHGSIADLLTFAKFETPIIYQSERIYKEIKNNEDRTKKRK